MCNKATTQWNPSYETITNHDVAFGSTNLSKLWKEFLVWPLGWVRGIWLNKAVNLMFSMIVVYIKHLLDVHVNV